MSENVCEVLLIGGRSGVGKSTVAWEVSSRLRDLGVAHAFLEGDFLDQVHPAPEDDPARTQITAKNLAAIWGNYREIGQTRLIYCNTVAVLEPDMITEAMGGTVTPIGVLLTADDTSAEARLREREIGGYLEPHLQRGKGMARHLDAHTPDWVHRVATDGRTVPETAEAVIDLTGWADTAR